MNILLAVDGSTYSRKAASWLARHAAALRSRPRITLLTVHVPVPYRGVRSVGASVAGMDRYYETECEKALAPASLVLRRAGIAHEALWRVGDPAAEIAATAKKRRASLVVMGSHGKGALAGLVLGSTVTKVLASSNVPVLVVR
jgi:nucleotide-binding universal stress UspA family protein